MKGPKILLHMCYNLCISNMFHNFLDSDDKNHLLGKALNHIDQYMGTENSLHKLNMSIDIQDPIYQLHMCHNLCTSNMFHNFLDSDDKYHLLGKALNHIDQYMGTENSLHKLNMNIDIQDPIYQLHMCHNLCTSNMFHNYLDIGDIFDPWSKILNDNDRYIHNVNCHLRKQHKNIGT